MAIEIKAPMVGSIFQIPVEVGQTVEAEDELIVLESMKMEIPVTAPAAGTVTEIRVQVSDSVQEGDVLLLLD